MRGWTQDAKRLVMEDLLLHSVRLLHLGLSIAGPPHVMPQRLFRMFCLAAKARPRTGRLQHAQPGWQAWHAST